VPGTRPPGSAPGGVSVYLLASALLPAPKMTAAARAARVATALAAMGLVFMGAIVEPVYLVPALTAVLALGLWAETRRRPLPAMPAPHPRGQQTPGLAAADLQPIPAVASQSVQA
jgi:hypothetical protein